MIVVPISAAQSDAQVVHSLETILTRAAPQRRLTIMTHGYRFAPDHPVHCPHNHILADRPAARHFKAISWARHLRLGRDGTPPGIGFGWQARGGLNAAYERALTAGDRLGEVIGLIARRRPDLRVNIVAHSLGARVALRAVAMAPEGAVDRVLLLSAAEYAQPARAHLDSEGGRAAQVINVASGENTMFNLMFRALVRPDRPFDRHATGALHDLPNWTEITIDAKADRAAAAHLGFPIRPAPTRICHWSTYLRGGVFPLYRALLDPDRPALLPSLRAALQVAQEAPAEPDPAGGAPNLRWL